MSTTTSTTSKKSRTRFAALTMAAIVGLGGASTFAAWSQDDTQALPEREIQTGGWTFDLATAGEAWYDASPELDADEDGTVDQTERSTIALESFYLVPGTVIQGEVQVDADLTSVVGEWLDAEVGQITIDGQPVPSVSWLTASAQVVAFDTVMIEIEFPFDESDYEGQSSLTDVAVDLGSLQVTVDQVRDAYATP